MENIENGRITDLKSFRRRSVIRRLWESYAADLISILKASNEGKCSQHDAQMSISEIIPTMKKLRDGGKLEQILQKADLVILDKVFNDVTVTGVMEPNEVDLTSEEL